jgi:hypothetical protein
MEQREELMNDKKSKQETVMKLASNEHRTTPHKYRFLPCRMTAASFNIHLQ